MAFITARSITPTSATTEIINGKPAIPMLRAIIASLTRSEPVMFSTTILRVPLAIFLQIGRAHV